MESMSASGLIVVKVGGGLSAIPGALDVVGRGIAAAARRHRILVVPGGGPFADAVRAFEQREPLSADAAHWMAILAMDQYAQVLVERIPGAALLDEPGAIRAALPSAGGIAVLAPARWLRAADVLPHNWSATSDSAAAFVAGALDASHLVLIKPRRASTPADLVDESFAAVLPVGLRWSVLSWEDAAELDQRL